MARYIISQRRRVCKPLWCILILISFSHLWAQECVNYITVNGRPLEGKPACYFSSYGDDRTPHIEAELLAQALGANLVFDDRNERYIFARANDLVEINASRDIQQGLVRRDGVLYANGRNLRSTMALLVADVGYIPIAPVVDAFNGKTSWEAGRRSVHIVTSNNAYNSEAIANAFTPSETPASSNMEAALDLTPINGQFVVSSLAHDRASHDQPANNAPASSDVATNAPATNEPANTATHAAETAPEDSAATVSQAIADASSHTASQASAHMVNIRPQSVVPIPIDSNAVSRPLPHPAPQPHPQPNPTPAPHPHVTAPSPITTPTATPAPVVMPPVMPVQPNQPAPAPVHTVPDAVPVTGIYRLAPPRVGLHQDRTRVALDIPTHIPYHLAVNGNIMLISLPYTEAFSYDYPNTSNYVQNVRYALLENTLTLIITTSYAMTSDGYGYNFNFLGDTDGDGLGVLYVDFSPYLRGDSLDVLQNYPLSEAQPHTSDAPEAMQHLASTSPIDMDALAPTPLATISINSNPITPEMSTAEVAPIIQQPEAVNTLAAAPATQRPHRVVVIDPGHGGWDPGAQGYASEAEVVLGVSLHLKRLLEQEGIDVILTRDRDVSLTDEKRSDLAARAELTAGAENNLFISIHANAAHNAQAHGIETWVFGQPLNPSLLELAILENGGGEIGRSLTAEAQDVAENALTGWLEEEQLRLSLSLAESVQENMVSITGARNRGVRKNAWYVIRNAQIPAILVEVGFVSNAREGAKLATDSYQLQVAEGIANGIHDFFGEPLSIASN